MDKTNKAMPKCIFCGGTIMMDDVQMCKDLYLDYENDCEAVVHEAHCTRCGRMYQIIDPSEESRTSEYKNYWNGNS